VGEEEGEQGGKECKYGKGSVLDSDPKFHHRRTIVQRCYDVKANLIAEGKILIMWVRRYQTGSDIMVLTVCDPVIV
jgi:hypothetical protein